MQLYVMQLHQVQYQILNEKALIETQTMCAGGSKGEPKILRPPQTPFPGHRTAKI